MVREVTAGRVVGGGPRAPPLAAAAVCVPAAAHLAQTYRERPQSHPRRRPGIAVAARNRSDSRRPGSRAAAVRAYPPARSRAGIRLEGRSPAFRPCAGVLK